LKILIERPTAKSYYKCNNSQTLKRNNEISLSLLKTLLRHKSTVDEFSQSCHEIFKVFDTITVKVVWDRIRRALDKDKKT